MPKKQQNVRFSAGKRAVALFEALILTYLMPFTEIFTKNDAQQVFCVGKIALFSGKTLFWQRLISPKSRFLDSHQLVMRFTPTNTGTFKATGLTKTTQSAFEQSGSFLLKKCDLFLTFFNAIRRFDTFHSGARLISSQNKGNYIDMSLDTSLDISFYSPTPLGAL